MISLDSVYKLQNALRAAGVSVKKEIAVESDGEGFTLSLGSSSSLSIISIDENGKVNMALFTPNGTFSEDTGWFDRIDAFLFLMKHRSEIK